jgi:hypothetical protein
LSARNCALVIPYLVDTVPQLSLAAIVYHFAQPDGAEPLAALLGVGGRALVVLLTRMQTKVPVTSDGHGVFGFEFQKLNEDAGMPKVDSREVHVSFTPTCQ